MTAVQKILLSIHPVWMMALSVVLVVFLVLSMRSGARRARRASRRSTPEGSMSYGHKGRRLASAIASGRPKRENDTTRAQRDGGEPEANGDLPSLRALETPSTGEVTVRQPSSSRKAQRSAGTRKGMAFADDFAAAYVAWVRHEGRAGEWPVDDVLRMACEFADKCRREMPVARNFLQSLKRQRGVVVRADRRIYNSAGTPIGKTTFYELSPPDFRNEIASWTGRTAELAASRMSGLTA